MERYKYLIVGDGMLTSGMKPPASWTRGWKPLRIGRSRTAREWFITYATAASAAGDRVATSAKLPTWRGGERAARPDYLADQGAESTPGAFWRPRPRCQ